MSLFQCEVCGCVENTALACQGSIHGLQDSFDWAYAPERKYKRLCSACGPVLYAGDEGPTEFGVWHGQFARTYLPMGQFRTGPDGGLWHLETGRQDYMAFALPEPA